MSWQKQITRRTKFLTYLLFFLKNTGEFLVDFDASELYFHVRNVLSTYIGKTNLRKVGFIPTKYEHELTAKTRINGKNCTLTFPK